MPVELQRQLVRLQPGWLRIILLRAGALRQANIPLSPRVASMGRRRVSARIFFEISDWKLLRYLHSQFRPLTIPSWRAGGDDPCRRFVCDDVPFLGADR